MIGKLLPTTLQMSDEREVMTIFTSNFPSFVQVQKVMELK